MSIQPLCPKLGPKDYGFVHGNRYCGGFRLWGRLKSPSRSHTTSYFCPISVFPQVGVLDHNHFGLIYDYKIMLIETDTNGLESRKGQT